LIGLGHREKSLHFFYQLRRAKWFWQKQRRTRKLAFASGGIMGANASAREDDRRMLYSI
jgi:hypothetical protein